MTKIDVSQLSDLSKALRKVDPALVREMNKALKVSGEIVATDARGRASFSSKIPGSIKVRRRGNSVRIQAGGARAPSAAAFEHGGQPGPFRHPVFGNTAVWVSQPSHPFLGPAAEATEPRLLAAVLAAVDDAFRAGGFT